jgi:HrpA-like RNA helicase
MKQLPQRVFQHHRRLLQRSSTCRKAPYFALHIRIAIGFLKAIGFRTKPKRTILDFWCGDPWLSEQPLLKAEICDNPLTHIMFPASLEQFQGSYTQGVVS